MSTAGMVCETLNRMHKHYGASLLIVSVMSLQGNAIQPQKAETPAVIEKHGSSTERNIPTIRSQTNLVLVPVSVRDASGGPVGNLKIQDFSVTENQKAVTLVHLGKPEMTRLEIVLVFDLTSSLWYYFDLVREAASGFVRSMYRPGDAVSVVGISSEPQILLKRTESLPAILDGLNGFRRFGAATAFFDAVIAAARLFPNHTDPETRRILIVLSDGEDNFSKANLEKALKQIQKVDGIFYSINPGILQGRLNRVSQRGQGWMETLADQTGGTAFLAESFENLSEIYGRIAEELKVQYLLGYNSPEPMTDGEFRSISVTIPDNPELRLRARRGYYADRKTSP